ncbi:hypothetical protein YC2023_060836 [Brassica napus]
MDPVHRILASLRDKPLKELMLGKEDWTLGSRTYIQLNQSNHTEDGLHPTIETANRPLIGVMIKTSVSIMAQDVTHILPRGDQTYKQTVMGTHVHRLETDCLSLKIALGLRKQETSVYREYLKEVNGGQYKKALPHVNLTSHILPLLDPTENRCTPPVLELVKTYIGLERIPLLLDGEANTVSGRLQGVTDHHQEDGRHRHSSGGSSNPSNSRAAGKAPMDQSPIRTLSEDRRHVSLRLGPMVDSEETIIEDIPLPRRSGLGNMTNLKAQGKKKSSTPSASRKISVKSPLHGISDAAVVTSPVSNSEGAWWFLAARVISSETVAERGGVKGSRWLWSYMSSVIVEAMKVDTLHAPLWNLFSVEFLIVRRWLNIEGEADSYDFGVGEGYLCSTKADKLKVEYEKTRNFELPE